MKHRVKQQSEAQSQANKHKHTLHKPIIILSKTLVNLLVKH